VARCDDNIVSLVFDAARIWPIEVPGWCALIAVAGQGEAAVYDNAAEEVTLIGGLLD
jgi:hypothetical protein